MKKITFVIIGVSVLGVGIYYFVYNSATPNTTITQSPSVSITTSASSIKSPQMSMSMQMHVPSSSTTSLPTSSLMISHSPSATPTSPQSPTATPRISSTPTLSTISIDIQNFAFSPTDITVKAGTKITWTNRDGAPHTVTSDTGSVLNSSTLSNGDSFSFTFNSTGTFAYHCTFHPSMKGAITVTQ